MILYFIAAAAMLAADQALKLWVSAHIALGEALPLWPGVVELRLVHNYGAAWSSFSGMRWLLLAVTTVIVIAVAFLLIRGIVRHPLGRWAGTAIIAGGLGNILDRLRLGYVVDMFHLQFMNYPVFNIADIFVVLGTIAAAVYYLWFYEKYDRKGKEHGTAGSADKP